MNVAKTLTAAAKNFPDKPAVIFEDKPISFTQLRNAAFCLANGLKKLGLNKDDKVTVYLPNIPGYILSYLAVYSLGGIIVPLDFMLTQDELENLINHSQAKVLITKQKKNIDLKKLKRNSSLKQIILLDQNPDFLNFHNLIQENSPVEPQAEISDSGHSTIFYTSGSTGHPKGVLLNYRHLDGPVKAIEYFLPLRAEQDIILCSLPFSHSGGWIYILVMLYFGITMILQERFQPLEFIKNISKYKVSIFWTVPSMYIALVSLKEFAKSDLASLKYAVVFGAPSSPVLLKRFHRVCPKAYLLNGWGMTETSPPNVVLPLGCEKIESVGKPVPWSEIKICNEDDKELGVDQVGELVIRGWVVMQGYYREPELTQEVISNGWFHTGDLARIDPEGLLYIVGRKKEMIKVGGEVVYAPEVEQVIHRHLKVSEVAVLGVPDKLRGEVPKAFLVLNKGEKLSEDELRYFCREHLAHFKIPHYFEFVKDLPKTRSGKIAKQALLEG